MRAGPPGGGVPGAGRGPAGVGAGPVCGRAQASPTPVGAVGGV